MPELNNTNMDIKKNPNATTPVFEFTLPTNELEADMEVGEVGEVIVPVEVIQKSSSSITFRKLRSARAEKSFRKESLSDMRSRIGVVEDPMNETDEDESEDEKED